MGGTKAVSACKVLDADAGSWLSLPPLARARTRCAVVGKGSLLYVLGGETRHKQGRRQTRTPLADVDRFDADGWKWEMIASLPREATLLLSWMVVMSTQLVASMVSRMSPQWI